MESKCTFTPVCGVTCGENCHAFNPKSNPLCCEVMNAAIRAFQAQEDYWANKIELDRRE